MKNVVKNESVKRLLFEQQERESDKAFAAFRAYLAMGPERSLDGVAQRLSKSGGLMRKWSAKFDWPARVQAHAAYFGALERAAGERAAALFGASEAKRRQMEHEDEWLNRSELMAGARACLRLFIDGERSATLGDVARALDIATKLGRLSANMASEITEVQTHVSGTIDLEWKAALAKAYGTKQVEATAVVDVEEVKP